MHWLAFSGIYSGIFVFYLFMSGYTRNLVHHSFTHQAKRDSAGHCSDSCYAAGACWPVLLAGCMLLGIAMIIYAPVYLGMRAEEKLSGRERKARIAAEEERRSLRDAAIEVAEKALEPLHADLDKRIAEARAALPCTCNSLDNWQPCKSGACARKENRWARTTVERFT